MDDAMVDEAKAYMMMLVMNNGIDPTNDEPITFATHGPHNPRAEESRSLFQYHLHTLRKYVLNHAISVTLTNKGATIVRFCYPASYDMEPSPYAMALTQEDVEYYRDVPQGRDKGGVVVFAARLLELCAQWQDKGLSIPVPSLFTSNDPFTRNG